MPLFAPTGSALFGRHSSFRLACFRSVPDTAWNYVISPPAVFMLRSRQNGFPCRQYRIPLNARYHRGGKILQFSHQGIIHKAGLRTTDDIYIHESIRANPTFTATGAHFVPVEASYGFMVHNKRFSWGIYEIRGLMVSGRFVQSKSGSEYALHATPEEIASCLRRSWWFPAAILVFTLLATVCFVKSAAGFWRQNRYENKKLARKYRALREKQADKP
nr:hypothetical protein LVJ77_04075 [Conchiformibius kuhniae]